jgi:hypothetical protein
MRLNPRQGAVVSARLGEHRDHARDGVRQVVVPSCGMIDAVATAPRRAALEQRIISIGLRDWAYRF